MTNFLKIVFWFFFFPQKFWILFVDIYKKNVEIAMLLSLFMVISCILLWWGLTVSLTITLGIVYILGVIVSVI